jgi:hypothetical protein
MFFFACKKCPNSFNPIIDEWYEDATLKIWHPSEDFQLIDEYIDDHLISFNIINLKMQNHTLREMIIRLITMKEMHGPSYKDIKSKCKEKCQEKSLMKWELTNDHTSRNGKKWLKDEDDFIKICYYRFRIKTGRQY